MATAEEITLGYAAELAGKSAWQLADMADCLTPDSLTSPGAALLTGVRNSMVEMITSSDDMDTVREGFHEIADSAPNVYTSTLWSQFVDLGGYQEDLTELTELMGGMPDQWDKLASVALYTIAERLCLAILADLETALGADTEDLAEHGDGDDHNEECPECGTYHTVDMCCKGLKSYCPVAVDEHCDKCGKCDFCEAPHPDTALNRGDAEIALRRILEPFAGDHDQTRILDEIAKISYHWDLEAVEDEAFWAIVKKCQISDKE